MPSAPEKLTALRHLLAARFPSVPRTASSVLPTGIPSLDDAIGGLPLGAITEIVCAAPSCGGQLLIGQLLAVTRVTRTRVALIDSTDSFDPSSFADDLLAHLVWVRGATTIILSAKASATAGALHAADLLARDANLGLVILDLRRAPAADLRRIPSTQWYRLQRAVDSAELAFVVITPRATVPSAQVRFALATLHIVAALDRERPALTAALTPLLQRQRQQPAAAAS